jgi:glycosyltransferase involved in cell wall biosynthesis
LRIPDGTFAVGTITRLMPSKGNEFLVRAMKPVVERLPNARCYIVGEGELQGELATIATQSGVGREVELVGFRADVAEALSAFDLVVFPSLWEGTPLTAFEALAMGKPIVSTDADGLQDVLTPDHDAVIVPRRQPAAIAEAIVALANDEPRRTRLAANARRTGARYDIDRFVKKMERLYVLLHETSRATRRRSVLTEDLSFLD